MAIDDVNVGFISCGGRAGEHMKVMDQLDGVNVAALCDPDENRLGQAQSRFAKAIGYPDLRKLLDDDAVAKNC